MSRDDNQMHQNTRDAVVKWWEDRPPQREVLDTVIYQPRTARPPEAQARAGQEAVVTKTKPGVAMLMFPDCMMAAARLDEMVNRRRASRPV